MYDYGERVNQCADYGDVRLRGKGRSMCELWRCTITGKRSRVYESGSLHGVKVTERWRRHSLIAFSGRSCLGVLHSLCGWERRYTLYHYYLWCVTIDLYLSISKR